MARNIAHTILEALRAQDITDTQILDYMIANQLSGDQAERSMRDAQEEFLPDSIDEDGYNWLTSGK